MKQHPKTIGIGFYLSSVIFIIGSAMLLMNIFSSQMISPLFSGLTNDDKRAAVEYLQKIRSVPEFTRELNLYESKFGQGFKDLVYIDERKRQNMIVQLEEMLKQNPKARDVLYGLYLLYKEDGNGSKASEYLKRALEVDPTIKAN